VLLIMDMYMSIHTHQGITMMHLYFTSIGATPMVIGIMDITIITGGMDINNLRRLSLKGGCI
jgi:hypothetical protein